MRIGSCRERHRRTRRGSRIVIPRCEATWESRSTRPHRGKAIGKIATAFPRLPRAQSALAMTNLLALRHRIRAAKPTACKALNPRKGDAASVRRQSRQRLRSERCYTPYFGLFHFNGGLYGLRVPRRARHASPLQRTTGSPAALSTLHFPRKKSRTCVREFFSQSSIQILKLPISPSGSPLRPSGPRRAAPCPSGSASPATGSSR